MVNRSKNPKSRQVMIRVTPSDMTEVVRIAGKTGAKTQSQVLRKAMLAGLQVMKADDFAWAMSKIKELRPELNEEEIISIIFRLGLRTIARVENYGHESTEGRWVTLEILSE